MLRELAEPTGLSAQVTAVLADTYRGPWTYDPGAVFADRRRTSARHPRRRAHARAGAWAAGAAPVRGEWLHLDVDATITLDHSDNKEKATPTWKKTFGHHPLLVFLDCPEIAGGEALAGLLRAGNAGSNTAADHITVLKWALDSLPKAYRPKPDDPGAQQILV